MNPESFDDLSPTAADRHENRRALIIAAIAAVIIAIACGALIASQHGTSPDSSQPAHAHSMVHVGSGSEPV
jgi:hypothetical protein